MTELTFLDIAAGRIGEQAQGGGMLALSPITQALDASYTLLFRTDRGRDVVEDASCYGVDTGYVERLKDAARERLLPGWLGRLRPGSVLDRAAFGTDREFARTPFYNHVIRPEGRFHCLIATPFVSDRSRIHLVVGRPQTHGEFNERDQTALQLLLPYIAAILGLQVRLQEAQSLLHRTIDLLGGRTSPIMIAGRDGELLLASEAARRWLARGVGLHIDRAARLQADTATDTGLFRRALRAVAAGSDARSLVLRRDDGSAIQLTIKRFSGPIGPGGDLGREPTRLLVHVDDPTMPDTTETLLRLARDHGLTARETELLVRLSDGTTVKQAADQLGMTYNTARTHLRHVFSKLDLHRQSDLLRLCATGRRPAS